ncbi:MAG: TlpA family protein disulfide reductase [Acidimicrobiales bacterium]
MTALDPTDAGPGTPVRHAARWIAVGVLVVAAGLVAVLATRPPATVAEVQSPLVGEQVPPVSGPTINGDDYTLSRPPGRYVVVNFFASWCEPCQEEGPELVKYQYQHQQSGSATMLSVVFDDTTAAARTYQETLGTTWPTLTDPGGRLALSFGVRAPPSTFVVAPDGRVVAYVVAPVTAADLDQIIARAEASGP